MKFEDIERIAFARIISDLIEADFIVEEDEMKSFDEIREKKDFKITDKMLSKAKRITFAEAVGVLQKIKNEEKKQLIKRELYNMSLSDGTCVPLEALLIMAVKYALEGKGQVFSIPEGCSFVDNMKILYIENEDNTETDAYIKSHYRSISNEFRLADFDFVYIPQIVDDFRQINGDYLHKVITYMMPSIDDAKVIDIQNDLCSMTTSRFSHELLYKKMGINMLSSKPAFLIKIGESSVADKSGTDDMERNMHSNFLLVPIDKIGNTKNTTILDNVVELMDTYRSMVSENLVIKNRPLTKKFLYYGFHRSLFDLIAYGKEKKDYKIIIELRNVSQSVFLRPVDIQGTGFDDNNHDIPINISNQESALYIQMIYMSLINKGLDWKIYDAESKKYIDNLRINNAIYSPISQYRTNTKYRDKTHVSHIVKALKTFNEIITNIDLLIPRKISEGNEVFYNVPISSDFVFVIEKINGIDQEIKMQDSTFWKELSS